VATTPLCNVGLHGKSNIVFVREGMVMTGQKGDRGRTFEIDLWATIVAYVLALLMIILATQLHV
jgi:hypothetical protein